MDLQEIKNLLAREKNVKIIIVEDGKPVMIISNIENSEIQPKLDFNSREEEVVEEPIRDTRQSTELIGKEEMPVDELRVEDLPF